MPSSDDYLVRIAFRWDAIMPSRVFDELFYDIFFQLISIYIPLASFYETFVYHLNPKP